MWATAPTGTYSCDSRVDYWDRCEENAMDNITIFNLREVNKGALKATVSIRLGSDLTIHDCKII